MVRTVSGGVFTNAAKVICEERSLPMRPVTATDRSVDSCLAGPRPLISSSLCQDGGLALMLALMLSLCLQMKDCCGLQPALQPACPEVLVQHILGMQVSVMDL